MTNPHPIDVYAGTRVREGRHLRNMSQSDLGRKMSNPVAFQQIQKYESGSNRISMSRIYEISRLLDLPLSYFLPISGNETPPVMSKEEHMLVERYRKLSKKCQQSFFTLFTNMTDK